MIISRLSAPVEIVNPEYIAEFIGYDPDQDLAQDKVLKNLIAGAVGQGEQITGIIWAETEYLISSVEAYPPEPVYLPLSPVFAISGLEWIDEKGVPHELESSEYTFYPADIELGRPWAQVILPVIEDMETINLQVKAGWTEETLPASILAWISNRVSSLYDIRGDLQRGTRQVNVELSRWHSLALLDRWVVRGGPDVFSQLQS